MDAISLQTTYYILALDIFCMLLMFSLYFFVRNITKNVGKKLGILLILIIIFHSITVITNDISVLSEALHFNLNVLYITNSIYFVSLAAAEACYLVYVCSTLEIPFTKNKPLLALFFLPAVAIMVLAITAPINNLLYSMQLDASGNYVYQRGSLYNVNAIISYGYIGVTLLVSILAAILRSGKKKKEAIIFSVGVSSVIIFFTLQYITGLNISTIGFTIAFLIYFSYVIIRTTTEQQQNLENALKLAESASRAKTTFLNNVSHDIRTPMNAIIGYKELASKHIDDRSRVEDYLAKIGSSSAHLLSLINDVLDMSRIESGKMVIIENEEDLVALGQNLANIIRVNAEEKKQNFIYSFDGVKKRHVLCDKLRLNQVLLNVLSNAVKYTKEGGIITFTINENETKDENFGIYECIIKDNGIGMSEEFIETIYEPFTRVNSSTASGIQGTGLGMAITKNIVDMMNGNIEIDSKEGKGTTVTLTFYLRYATKDVILDNEKIRTNEDEIDESIFVGKKILLVEDNELNCEIATEILSEAGFVIDSAANGEIAVNKMLAANDESYDLILMDIQMPKMNGIEATYAIRKMDNNLCKNIPIIAMTANAFEEDRKIAFESGMNDYIAKPIDIKKMKTILARFFR